MVTTALYFLLGFLAALFVVLAAAPAIWRRAVVLTERRIQATMPISRQEISAEKDALRAEHAMAVRRLEMSRDKLSEKVSLLEAEDNRKGEDIKLLVSERDDQIADIAQLQSMLDEANEEIAGLNEENAGLGERLAEAKTEVRAKLTELSELSQQLSVAAMDISNHEVELANREAELARQSEQLRTLREKLRETEEKRREAKADLKAARGELKTDKSRLGDLDSKYEKLTSANAELEDRLERRSAEIKRLKEEIREKNREASDLAKEVRAADRNSARLEKEVARLGSQVGRGRTVAANSNGASAKASNRAVEKLEDEIHALKEENASLVKALARSKPAKNGSGNADAELREQMQDIAARIVAMTAMVQGEISPINEKLKSGKSSDTPPMAPAAEVIDLAERIKALREKI